MEAGIMKETHELSLFAESEIPEKVWQKSEIDVRNDLKHLDDF